MPNTWQYHERHTTRIQGPMKLPLINFPDCQWPDGSKALLALHTKHTDGAFRNGGLQQLAYIGGTLPFTLRRPSAIFRGLCRQHAAHERTVDGEQFLAYVASPRHTETWESIQRVCQSTLPPPNKVFVAWVAPNVDFIGQYPDVVGWIDHWAWVKSDARNPLYPVEFDGRFVEKLWER